MSEKLEARLNSLTYHRPSLQVQDAMSDMRRAGMDFMTYLDGNIVECREKSLAVTAFEETMMWAMKALALTDSDGTIVSPHP